MKKPTLNQMQKMVQTLKSDGFTENERIQVWNEIYRIAKLMNGSVWGIFNAKIRIAKRDTQEIITGLIA